MNDIEKSIELLKSYGIDAKNFTIDQIIESLDKIIDYKNFQIVEKQKELKEAKDE